MVSSFPSAPAVVLSVREVKVKSAFEIGEKMRTRKKDVFDFVCKGRIPYANCDCEKTYFPKVIVSLWDQQNEIVIITITIIIKDIYNKKLKKRVLFPSLPFILLQHIKHKKMNKSHLSQRNGRGNKNIKYKMTN